jgi:quercetin dioxygenase-like cupin family protein
MESKYFILESETPVTDLGGGVKRQILGFNDQLMTVKVIFNKGAIGTMHAHVHSQTSYCASGKFEFRVGDESQVLLPGDGVYIPSGMLHGVVCLEDGILVDSFNPVRQDFI